jgi:taurine dioxygenase
METGMQTGKLAIGCSIHGVDAKSLTPGQMLKLKDLLYKNRLIILKDQSLNEQEYCDFARRAAPGSRVPTSRTTTTTPNAR